MYLSNLRDISCLKYVEQHNDDEYKEEQCCFCKLTDERRYLKTNDQKTYFHAMCAWLDGATFKISFDAQFSTFNEISVESWKDHYYWNFHPIEINIE